MTETDNNLLLRAYFLRHQESHQNAGQRGDADTDLSTEGAQKAVGLGGLLVDDRLGGIDVVLSGDLKRHKQTLEPMLESSGFAGEVFTEPRLNAIFGDCHLLHQDPEVTVREHGLERFAAGSDGLYRGTDEQGPISFDPVALKVNPFDHLYCAGYMDERLRALVFPGVEDLPSFDLIRENTEGVQQRLIDMANGRSGQTPGPLNVLLISSCSPSGYHLEYSAHGTIGNHISVSYSGDGRAEITRFGSGNNPIFPQEHGDVMVLGYTVEDGEEGRNILRALEGNVNIGDYLANLE